MMVIFVLSQNYDESSLNYSWHQVSILRMRGMDNNILSVAILSSVNKKNVITDVWLMASVKKLPTLDPSCCVKKCSTCISTYCGSNYNNIVKG